MHESHHLSSDIKQDRLSDGQLIAHLALIHSELSRRDVPSAQVQSYAPIVDESIDAAQTEARANAAAATRRAHVAVARNGLKDAFTREDVGEAREVVVAVAEESDLDPDLVQDTLNTMVQHGELVLSGQRLRVHEA